MESCNIKQTETRGDGMASQDQSFPGQPTSPLMRRSFVGCLVTALVFLLGLVIGATTLLAFVLFAGGADRPPLAQSPSSANDALVVQLSKTYLTQITQRNIKSTAIPGEIKNIQLSLTHAGPITVSADSTMSVLGFSTTKQFSVQLQPVVRNCKMEVRVLHADMQGIPVTSFVASLEGQINQQLQLNVTDLPDGFNYCAVKVRTEPEGIFIHYSASLL
jgi:hypothetical protein